MSIDDFTVDGVVVKIVDGLCDVMFKDSTVTGEYTRASQHVADTILDQICEQRGLIRSPVYLGVNGTSAHCRVWEKTAIDHMKESMS